MFKKLSSVVRAWFGPSYQVSCVPEEPVRMNKRTVYVIGEDRSYWAAVFTCPCGCREKIWLNLLKHDNRPTWTVEDVKGAKVHITPSVWRQTGCKSHFLIKRGRLIWVGKKD